MADSQTILVCDDEPHLREMVSEYLSDRGYSVLQSRDAAEMQAVLARKAVDLLVLDINMPGEDGLSALRRLRETSNLPVIMLTAASDVIDRVVGLEMGADDYLGKPIDMRELLARVKAALRRSAPLQQQEAPRVANGTVSFGACQLDLAAARLFSADGSEIPITAMEFNLLQVFANHRGKVLNRDQLLDLAHDKSWEPFDRSIDIRVSRLRRKVEENPAKPKVIETIRGIGYLFR